MAGPGRRVLAFLPYAFAGVAAFALVALPFVTQSNALFYVFIGGLAVFLAIGYWTWWRVGRNSRTDRAARQRRWGMRKRVDAGDRGSADGR